MKTQDKYNEGNIGILKCAQCGKIISDEDFDDSIFKDDYSFNELCRECQDDLTAILNDE